MIRHIFKSLSLISAILLACTMILWAWSFWTNPCKSYLSVNNGFHISLLNGRIEFFSSNIGPYHGDIISLSGYKEFAERRGFGDAYGIYYRYFRWADSGIVLWTLSVSLFYPMIVLAVLPTISLWSWRRRVTGFLGALQEMFGPRQEMLSVIRLYWWMGVIGAVVYFVAACTIVFRLVLRVEQPSLDNLGPLAFCSLAIVAFGTSIHVAHRLRTKPAGMLSYARMVGIILATAWFPILTIPGIICVRRVTKHFAAYCESMHSGVGNQSAPKPAKGVL